MSKSVRFKLSKRQDDSPDLGHYFTMFEESLGHGDNPELGLRVDASWFKREAWCVVAQADAPEFARRLREVAEKIDPQIAMTPAEVAP